jgi:hypothetical protein
MLAPEWMSFHVYKEAQRCPLSVSLQRSSYRQLWKGFGYPSRPNAAAISGIVVHDAAEAILNEFVKANVPSLMSPTAMVVLKELGGFTKILEDSLRDFFESQADNPRFVQYREELLRGMKQRLPQMRATLQALLVSYVRKASSKSLKDSAPEAPPAQENSVPQRFALGSGTFVEVDLEDTSAKWRGRIDIIEVDQQGCAITDLKSGSESDEHKEQLITYSMLWSEDAERNPSKRPVLSLRIVYTDRTIAVSVPDDEAMKKFRESIISSSDAVRESLNSPSVPANPSHENCRYCPVKLLCQPYWQSLSKLGTAEVFSSNQVTLIEAHGERAWLATVEASPILATNEKVVIRNYERGKTFWSELEPGLSIRLTDGLISSSEEGETPVLNLSMMSEALFLESV